MMRLASLALVLALAGCAGSTPTRFWTIEPVAAPAAQAQRPVGPLRVDAVHVPLAIDRLEVVQHDVQNRVTVKDFDRWSAPPGDLIQRTLTQDLGARLPEGSVIFPASPKPDRGIGIVVDILDLRQTAAGYAMTVSWNTDAEAPVGRQLDLTTPGGTDVAGQTEALGRLVGQLADSIAETVSSAPAGATN